MEPEECQGVDDEVARYIGVAEPIMNSQRVAKGKGKQRQLSQSPAQALSSSSPSSNLKPEQSPPSLSPPLLVHPSSSNIDSLSRPIAPVPFPVTFACDMIDGLEQILSIENPTLARIQAEFKIHFPGCFFKRKTFYKHRLYFIRAKQANILGHFASLGRTDEGQWANLVRGKLILIYSYKSY